MIPDVIAEHALAQPLLQSDRSSFAAEGVSTRALTWSSFDELSIVARDKIIVVPGEAQFEFHRYVRHGSAPSINAYVLPLFDECGDPADILAFRPGGLTATWLGRVSVAGAEQIYMPRRDLGEALDVRVDPLAWLRADRCGLVILDPERAVQTLRGVKLRVADIDHGRRLQTALIPPSPKIVVSLESRRDA